MIKQVFFIKVNVFIIYSVVLFHQIFRKKSWINILNQNLLQSFQFWKTSNIIYNYCLQMTPSHVEVNRCAGGCNHRQQSCLPTRVRKKKIPVSLRQNHLETNFAETNFPKCENTYLSILIGSNKCFNIWGIIFFENTYLSTLIGSNN